MYLVTLTPIFVQMFALNFNIFSLSNTNLLSIYSCQQSLVARPFILIT